MRSAAADLRRAHADLPARLRARHAEIEQAVLARVHAVSGPIAATDPTYTESLHAAVGAAIDYGLATLDHGERRPPPIPTALLAQARLAARAGISLDVVLRRYFSGYVLLGDFLIEEVEQGGALEGAALKRLLRLQARAFDRLLSAVSEEYARESTHRPAGSEKRRLERVRSLLAGEMLDSAELAYDLDACHLGLLAAGPGAAEALRDLARTLDRRLLLVRPDEGTAWAWLGGRRGPDLAELDACLASDWPAQAVLARGEPAEGVFGWRLSHRQAAAALPIALRGGGRLVSYADVALTASALQDDLLATSLRKLYLAPLGRERDGGAALRQTLRAYFGSARNASCAAAELGVSRQTVNSRLRTVEEHVGRSLESCTAELHTALCLGDLGGLDAPSQP